MTCQYRIIIFFYTNTSQKKHNKWPFQKCKSTTAGKAQNISSQYFVQETDRMPELSLLSPSLPFYATQATTCGEASALFSAGLCLWCAMETPS